MSERGAFAAVILLFAAQALVALAVIPPWQNPDEPQHLFTAHLVSRYGGDYVFGVDRDDAAERAIVASMAQHGWWAHYGRPTPHPVPATFAEGPAKVVDAYFGPPSGGSRLYYRAVAVLFRGGITDLLTQLYALRLLSALAGALAIACVWLGTRMFVDNGSALVVSALLALHPQYVLVSTTASPDAFVNLAGAVFWWRAGVLLTSQATLVSVASVWAAAFAGMLIRRMGAPLLIVAAAVTAVSIVSSFTRHGRRRITWGGTAVLVAAALVGMAWPALPADVHRAFQWIQLDMWQSLTTVVSRAEAVPRFIEVLFTTFWLSAGWLRYPGPAWWQAIVLGLSAIASIGLVVGGANIVGASRRVLWLAVSLVFVQTAVVVAYHFGILQSGAQGRYLFPIMPAALTLIWFGWREWFGPERQRAAAVSLLGLLVLLNTTAWTLVIMPVYVMDIPTVAIGVAGIVMSAIMTGGVLFHLAPSYLTVRAPELHIWRPAVPTRISMSVVSTLVAEAWKNIATGDRRSGAGVACTSVQRQISSPAVTRAKRVGTTLANCALVIGLLSLAVGGAVYAVTREPVRLINIRWSEGLSDTERLARQQRYALRNCVAVDTRTESCEILVQTRSNLAAIVGERAIEDTFYFDRSSLEFAEPAHVGTGHVWAAHAVPRLRRSGFLDWAWLAAGALVMIGLLPRLFGRHWGRAVSAIRGRIQSWSRSIAP